MKIDYTIQMNEYGGATLILTNNITDDVAQVKFCNHCIIDEFTIEQDKRAYERELIRKYGSKVKDGTIKN